MGPPPQGDARGLEQLLRPSPDLETALGRLAALTCARLRLMAPPLGDGAPVSVAGVLMAAAVGIAGLPKLASLVLQAVPPASHPSEWIVRHGVVSPVLAFVPGAVSDSLSEELRKLSPLTALLDFPAPGYEALALGAADRIRFHPAGRGALSLWIAEPSLSTPQRRWRATLLDRWRSGADGDRTYVLDIYEAAMVHHEATFIAQTHDAQRVLTDPKLSSDAARLADAMSIAAWWGPLSALERADIQSLRRRRHLGYAYRQGLALYRLTRKLTGAAA